MPVIILLEQPVCDCVFLFSHKECTIHCNNFHEAKTVMEITSSLILDFVFEALLGWVVTRGGQYHGLEVSKTWRLSASTFKFHPWNSRIYFWLLTFSEFFISQIKNNSQILCHGMSAVALIITQSQTAFSNNKQI